MPYDVKEIIWGNLSLRSGCFLGEEQIEIDCSDQTGRHILDARRVTVEKIAWKRTIG